MDYKIKIFLWDQFIRPLKKLLNRHIIQSTLIGLIFVNFFTFNSIYFFLISLTFVLLISILDIVHYWKSGKYIYNYRKEKYPSYRKHIKEFQK